MTRKAWIISERRFGVLGAERWTVEYYMPNEAGQKRIDADPDYEPDFNRDLDCIAVPCVTQEEALKEARNVHGDSFFGAATVRHEVLELIGDDTGEASNSAYWEQVGESVEVA